MVTIKELQLDPSRKSIICDISIGTMINELGVGKFYRRMTAWLQAFSVIDYITVATTTIKSKI